MGSLVGAEELSPLHPSLFHRAVSCGVCLGSHTALFRPGDVKQEQMSVGLKRVERDASAMAL